MAGRGTEGLMSTKSPGAEALKSLETGQDMFANFT
jgi:hypothetical protein